MSLNNPLGHQTSFTIHDSTYSTWRMGQGPLVIMLHGWPVTSQHWNLVAHPLSKAGFEVCCIDLKGLGESRNSRGSYAKADIASEILSLLDQSFKEHQSYSVVGHDWGGSIAIAMASLSKKINCLVVEEEIPPGITADIPEPGKLLYPNWHGGFHRTKPFSRKLNRT